MNKLMILTAVVAVACHAERQRTATASRPVVEHPPVERRAVEHPVAEDPAADDDETVLSAKRWTYASFFNRLKRKVAQNWDPASVLRRVDPKGTVYGTRTRVTEVRVSLSRQGEIAKIDVVSPSGVKELDDEAVRAFRIAAPFTGPPEGLVKKDDLITFAFSFFFEFGASHVTWRMPKEPTPVAPTNAPVKPLLQQAVPVEQPSRPAAPTDAQARGGRRS